jgi:hypothetical protein
MREADYPLVSSEDAGAIEQGHETEEAGSERC